MKRNLYIFIAQVPGIGLSLFYTLTALRLLGAAVARESRVYVSDEETVDVRGVSSVDPLAARGDCVERKSFESESGSDAESIGEDGCTLTRGSEGGTTATKMQQYMEILIMLSILGSAVFLGTLGTIAKLEQSKLETATGYLCNAFAIGFMSSPLATMASVIRTRSAASLDTPLSFMILLNGLFWVAYGFAMNDCTCTHMAHLLRMSFASLQK